MATAFNYFQCIQRCQRLLGRPVSDYFSDLENEFQLNIKSLVSQVNKDVLIAFTYPCRERTATLTIPAETTEEYSAVVNTIPGEIKRDSKGRSLLYDVNNNLYYTYNPDKADFIMGNAGSFQYCFRNNEILFDACEVERVLSVEYYTRKFVIAGVPYENFAEGTTTEKDDFVLETDYSILPGFLHEPILCYGACYYFESQKNESPKIQTFKAQFESGIKQLNAHNLAENQEFEFKLGNLDRDLRRPAF